MRAKRVDKNQSQIVKALRDRGVSVFLLHTVGKGCPDLLCGINNTTFLVEIKADAKATFTKDQIEFMAMWKGSPVHRISSEEEVVALLENMV